ncbi:Vegetative incompatibility protein HET-E-1, partial [Lachnellula arida]
MRLLEYNNDGVLSLTEFFESDIPKYAILSHRWAAEEVTFKDWLDGTSKSKAGYGKIRFCGEQARRDGLQYFWVDTCCIDKSSSTELAEAINSMFRWYQKAAICYVYFSDVSKRKRKANDTSAECVWESAFRDSEWFTRGWTLQELIAPTSVEFFSKDWEQLGNKRSLEQQIYEITGIPAKALRGSSLSDFSITERMSWAEQRETTRKEDHAYSLLGIFDVYMPLIYGEGKEHAFKRLREIINEHSKGIDSHLHHHFLETTRLAPLDKNAVLTADQRQRFLDSLRFNQIDARHATIKTAHTKTCKWLLTQCEYQDWLDDNKVSDHGGFLWIKGKPATGKSTMMKFAYANAKKSMRDTTIISFFFNARGEHLEKSTLGMYRSLLFQLLEKLPKLQELFDLLGSKAPNDVTQWNIEIVKSLFCTAVETLGRHSLTCFIDALDECEEDQLILEGQEGHQQDIAHYLHSELKAGRSRQVDQIKDEILERASGIFLQNMEELIICLQWILYAKRPLKREELYFAVLAGVAPEVLAAWSPEDITKQDMERFVLNSSKGLAETTRSKDQTVQFIHESVRDFFLKGNGLNRLRFDHGNNFSGLSHEQLKQCCQTYMRIDTSEHLPFSIPLPTASSGEAKDLRQLASEKFPFLEYATHNILHHADTASGHSISQSSFVEDFFLENWINLDNLFERYQVRRHTPHASLLYILAEQNLPNLIYTELKKAQYIDIEGERYRFPSHVALANKNESALRALLIPDTSIQHSPSIIREHQGLIGLLLENGPGISSQKNRTLLSWAAEGGHEAIVKLLLDTGEVEADTKDSDGR